MENGLVLFSLLATMVHGQDRCNPASNPALLVSTLNHWSFFQTPGGSTYPPNVDCHWLLKTSNPLRRLQLVINSSDIEDKLFTDCDDYAKVFDGTSANSVLISKWCGEDNPMYITSTSSSLYVRFKSDNYAKGAGVKFSFTEYAIPGCPPGWADDRKSGICYRFIYSALRNFTWVESQVHCNQEKANLMTFEDQNEYEMLYTIFAKNEATPWIGISDAKNEGSFENVDHSSLAWPDKPPLRPHPAEDCVFIDFTTINDQNVIRVDNCTTRRPFICKKLRDGSTVPYPPPEAAIRQGAILPLVSQWSPWFLWLLLLALLLIFLLICIPCLMVYCKKRHRRRVKVVDVNGAVVNDNAPRSNVNKVLPLENIERVHSAEEPVHLLQTPNDDMRPTTAIVAIEEPALALNKDPIPQRHITSSGSVKNVRPVTVHPVDVKVRSRVIGRFNRPQVHLLDNASSLSMDEFWREIG